MAHQGAPSWMSPVAVSFVFAVVSVPASILGNEAALKFGRHRAITAVMIASASVAVLIGLNVGAPAWAVAVLLLVYGLTVPADSGALTAGMSAAATREHRGATLALPPWASGFRPPAPGERAWRSISRAAGRAPRDGCWSSPYSRSGSRWARSHCSGPAPAKRKTRCPRNDGMRIEGDCKWIDHDSASSRRLVPPKRSRGDRATTCPPSWPIRLRAISASRRTGSSRPSRPRSSSPDC